MEEMFAMQPPRILILVFKIPQKVKNEDDEKVLKVY